MGTYFSRNLVVWNLLNLIFQTKEQDYEATKAMSYYVWNCMVQSSLIQHIAEAHTGMANG